MPLYSNQHYILKQIDLQNSLANYNYLLHCRDTNTTAAIDPTHADITLAALEEEGWTLDAILSTHHHADHIGGNTTLKEITGCHIIGNKHDAARIPAIDVMLEEGDTYQLGKLTAHIINVYGHTIGHIAYHFPDEALLFSGDTVFSMGCGRLFEGSAEQMTETFQKLAALPEDTLICAAHEYTRSNGVFALTIEPNNRALQKRMEQVHQLRAKHQPTVPSTLAIEKATNPFFRLTSEEILSNLNMTAHNNDADVFKTLRTMKDSF